MQASALTAAANGESVAKNGLKNLAENFENFLAILTTQLQNQDPLEPLKSSEFTSQLVQFTGVEQAVAQNKNLEMLVSLLKAETFLGATGYIGRTVDAIGDTTQLKNGTASWSYTLPVNANSVMVTIRNSDGQEVNSFPYETSEGNHTLTWDGKDNKGLIVPEGAYTLSVDARNFTNQEIGVDMRMSGEVTGVETTAAGEMLMIGNTRIPAASVLVVRQTPTI